MSGQSDVGDEAFPLPLVQGRNPYPEELGNGPSGKEGFKRGLGRG